MAHSFVATLAVVFAVLCFLLPARLVGERVGAGDLNTPGPGSNAESGHEPEDEEEHHGSPLSMVWKWGNFILLFGGLAYYLRQPLLDFLDSRARGIEQGLANGKRAEAEAQEKMSAIEARLARIDEEIETLRKQATREAEEERKRIVHSSNAEAEKVVAMAKREIEGLQRSARLELKAHVAELAVSLAEDRLRSDLSPEQNHRIISRFVRSLKDSKH